MTQCHTMTLCLIHMTTCHNINKYTLLQLRIIILIILDNINVTN